jgi:hypothetical protein
MCGSATCGRPSAAVLLPDRAHQGVVDHFGRAGHLSRRREELVPIWVRPLGRHAPTHVTFRASSSSGPLSRASSAATSPRPVTWRRRRSARRRVEPSARAGHSERAPAAPPGARRSPASERGGDGDRGADGQYRARRKVGQRVPLLFSRCFFASLRLKIVVSAVRFRPSAPSKPHNKQLFRRSQILATPAPCARKSRRSHSDSVATAAVRSRSGLVDS